jgi:Zn-dependent peptidase ImmA (M78 family)/transcriptional regulator with XRE-family HTH domain
MLAPSRLAVARKRQGLTLTQLAGLTTISTHSLSVYENGHQPPGPATLPRLARALNVSAAFLTGAEIEEIPAAAVSFRALSKMTARQRDRALADGRVALMINDWIEARFRLPDADIPTLTGHDPETAAEIVRARWGLGERPVRNMLHLLESHGTRIYSLTELNEVLDAYSLYWDGKPFVFLSTGKTGERGRFDAAHELGHLVLHGEHQVAGERPSAEAEANRFAAAFLMPRASVLAAGLVNAPVDRILAAKSQWAVAAMALTHRLHELDLLTDWGYRAACVALGRLGYKRAEPAGIPRETSQLLGKVLAQLRAEGVPPARIAASLGISVAEFRSHLFGLTLTAVPGNRAGWLG